MTVRETIENNLTIDPNALRDVLGYYPTGVVVITAVADDGQPVAMTVGTFTSVSLNPPLVGFLPAQTSKSFERLRTSGSFCVNVLGADQEVLCRAFASSISDKFSGVEWSPGPSGSPIIGGAVAWIDCDMEDVLEIGDHFLVTGRVRALDAPRRELPLLFFERGYGRFAPLQYVPRSPSALIPVLQAVEENRELVEAAAKEIGHEIVVMASVDDQIIHVAAMGSTTMHPSPVLGRRFPLAPPLGSLFIMNGTAAEKEAWMSRSSRVAEPGDRADCLAHLDKARYQGWVISLSSPRHAELDVMLDSIAHDVHTPAQGRELIRILDELRDAYDIPPMRGSGGTPVRLLTVPVFGQDREVVFQLGVYDLDAPADSPLVERTRGVLLATADRIRSARPVIGRS